MSKRKLIYDYLMEENDDRHQVQFQNNYLSQDSNSWAPCKPKKIMKNNTVCMSMSELDSRVLDAIDGIHQNEEHVSANRLIEAICFQMKISSLNQIIIDSVTKIDEMGSTIYPLCQHIALLSKIGTLIDLYVVSSMIATIADIENMLVEELGAASFNDLKIGPICRFPLVRRYFNLHKDVNRRFNITSSHVFLCLKNFAKKFPQKARDIFSFLDFLCKTHKLNSLSDLGIKIKDYSSALDILKNIESREKKLMELETEKLSKSFLIDLEKELQHLRERSSTSTPLIQPDESSSLVYAISCISIEKLVPALDTYTKRFGFPNSSSNNDCSESYKSLISFIRMLTRLVSDKGCEQDFLKIPLISSFFSCMRDTSSDQLTKILSNIGYTNSPPQKKCTTERTSFSENLKSYISSLESLSLQHLFEFEKNHKLIEHGLTCLDLLVSDKIFHKISLSSILKDKNPTQVMTSDYREVNSLLNQWAGHVPTKYAEIQILRHFQVSNLNELGISDFPQLYKRIPRTYISQSLINIDTFLCGYPPSPRQFSFSVSYSHQLCEIIELFVDFEAVGDKLLYVNYEDTFIHGSFNVLCNKLNSTRSINDSYVMISSSSSQHIFKVMRYLNPEESLIEAIQTFNSTTVCSILLSEIVTKANHWDSSVYSLLSMWLVKAFRLLDEISDKQRILDLIVDVFVHFNDRVSSLISSRILFPSFCLVFSGDHFYNILWESAAKKGGLSKLLKIGILENINELLTPDFIDLYVEQLKICKLTPKDMLLPASPRDVSTVSQKKIVTIVSPIRKQIECVPESGFSECKAIDLIDKIRKEQYFFEYHVSDPSVSKFIDSQIQRLNRSLEHLSADLYSDKLHFIRELFQNVDDSFNHHVYVSEPAVAWIIAREELVVLSNESGFTSNDILSLCDVGNSSKKDSMFIGSKGIGFKSVFQITDRPEIHSNNFHICFDYSKYGPLGYVMPESIPFDNNKIKKYIELVNPHLSTQWNTIFVFPFKKQVKSSLIFEIYQSINENIILFLNNLRCCLVINNQDNLTNLFRKHVDCNKITINKNMIETDWLYCSDKLCFDDKTERNRDISIAFRLPDPQVDVSNFHPSRELLYSFLPLNIYAFKFIINAPFELTSSRESILRGSDLNMTILASIPLLFLKSLQLLKSHFSNLGKCWFSSILPYLPIPIEFIEQPFDIVHKSILQILRTFPLIPCLGGGDYFPQNVVYIPKYFRDYMNGDLRNFVINCETFCVVMNSKIISFDIDPSIINIHKEILLSLGVVFFNFETFVELITKWFHSDFRNSLLNPTRIGIILGLMANLSEMKSNSFNQHSLCNFSSLPIIPVGDTFESCNSYNIYVLNSNLEFVDKVSFLVMHLRFLHPSALSASMSVCANEHQLFGLFCKLKMPIYDPYLNMEALVSCFYSTDQSLSDQISFLSYISNLWISDSSKINIDIINTHAYILTSQGVKIPTIHKVYLSSNDMINISTKLKSTIWHFIDDSFVSDPVLLSFLKSFCLLDAPVLYNIKFDNISFSGLSNIWDNIDLLSNLKKSIPFTGDDFTNSNLVDILIKGDNSERLFLAEYIDNHWDAIYSSSQASISSLRILIQSFSWLPTLCMTKSCKPSRLFNRTKQIVSFLGVPTQFLVSSYKFKNTNLASFLKIRSEPSPNDINMIFKHWKAIPSFSTTRDHVIALYRGIQEYARQYPCLIDSLISKRISLVFIPDKLSFFAIKTCAHDCDVGGVFVSHCELFIQDPIFNGAYLKYPPLSNIYDQVDIVDFFSQQLKINFEPSFQAYILMFSTQFMVDANVSDFDVLIPSIAKIGLKCLESLDIVDSIKTDKSCWSITNLYDLIKTKLNESRSRIIRETLIHTKCLPTHKGQLVAPTNKNFFVCDDFFLRENLSNLAELNFLKIDDQIFCQTFFDLSEQLVGILAFSCACEIPLLSNSCNISVDICQSVVKSSTALSDALTKSMPYLYSYIACKYPIYSLKLEESQAWENIKEIEIVQHHKSTITIYFKIDHFKVKVETGGFAVQDKQKLCFHHIDCEFSKGTINEPVCRQIIEEFLKFINRPSPALIRELSNFVKEIIITPFDKRLQCVKRFGYDTTLFGAHYHHFLQNFSHFSTDVPSISQLNYKVCYDQDSFVNEGQTHQITPVIQPRTTDLSLDQSATNSFSSDSTDKFIQVPANSFRSSYTDSVGRWGEAVINQMFRTHNLSLSVEETILEINWVNEVSESMLPYDFLLRTTKNGHEKNVYIEVKASSNPKSPSFELSIREIEFALHCKGNYHVYKVTPKTHKQSFELVKEDDCNIKIYKNIIHHLRKKYIRLVSIPNDRNNP